MVTNNFLSTKFNTDNFGKNLYGGSRVSQATTLHDGKVIGRDTPLTFENVGTGTGSYLNNKFSLSVTSGQYFIRNGLKVLPYFSGKAQLIEQSFDGFQTQAGVTKRIGYFSSNTVAPYDTSLDGFFLEDDGLRKRIKAYRNGVSTLDVPIENWDNYTQVVGYDWSKFTVIFWEFLWLGGAGLKLWLATDKGFMLLHHMKYVGTSSDTFILYPAHPVRYEIRSTTGTGSFRYLCGQVATEGGVAESGRSRTIHSLVTNSTPTVGTIYFSLAIRKTTTYRHTPIRLTGVSLGLTSSSQNDKGILMVFINPTITGTSLTWSPGNPATFEYAVASNVDQVITPGSGQEIYSSSVSVSMSGIIEMDQDYLAWIATHLNGTSDPIVLAYMPLTANQSSVGVINFKEY